MNKMVSQVLEWHKKFGVDVGDNPAPIEYERLLMRDNILTEEVKELYAAGVRKDIVEVADAICDVLYVAIGTAIEFGLQDKLEQLFDEVHRSNMSKLDENGNPIKREDGKILKSALFSPPNLKPIIDSIDAAGYLRNFGLMIPLDVLRYEDGTPVHYLDPSERDKFRDYLLGKGWTSEIYDPLPGKEKDALLMEWRKDNPMPKTKITKTDEGFTWELEKPANKK